MVEVSLQISASLSLFPPLNSLLFQADTTCVPPAMQTLNSYIHSSFFACHYNVFYPLGGDVSDIEAASRHAGLKVYILKK